MKFRYILYLFLISFVLVGCNSKKNKSTENDLPILRPAELILTSQDSADVQNLVDQYMNLFTNNDLEGASSILYTVDSGEAIPYSDEERQDFVNHLKIFQVFDYKISSLNLTTELNNEVALKLKIVPDGDFDTNKGVIQFVLNPVKINNHWYLTLRNLRAEGVKNVYELNQ